MPPNKAVCRVCLATDARLFSIAGTPLQVVYEKLTNANLVSGEAWPVAACYVCRAQLLKSHKLMLKAARAQAMLTAILQHFIEINVQSVSLLDRRKLGLCSPLTVSRAEYLDDIPRPATAVKDEPDDAELGSDLSDGPLSPASAMLDETRDQDGNTDVNKLKHNTECAHTEQQETVPLPEEAPAPIEPKQEIKEEKVAEQTVEDIKEEGDDSIPLEEMIRESGPAGQLEYQERGEVGDHTETDHDTPIELTREEKDGKKKRDYSRKKKLDSRNGASAHEPGAAEQEDDGTDSTHPSRGDSNAHNVQPAYKCNYCPRAFSQKLDLRSHLKIHGDDQPCKSDICQRRFQYRSDIKSHLNTHLGKKSLECHVCQRRFFTKQELKRHLVVHTSTKSFECNTCQRQFRYKCRLIKHLRTHTGKKPYECNVCQRRFSDKKYIKTHLRTHTGEKPYECNICQRRFLQRDHLNTHLRTHTGEKPYECNVCQRRFLLRGYLNIHLRTHTGEKPYECNVCQRRFLQRGHLNTHLRTHTGEKPYEFNVCHRRFLRKGALNIHLKTHNGEKPYECNVFQRRFSDKKYLKSHLRTHTGEKPYECNICHCRFSQTSPLNIHLKTHTGEKPHESNICQRGCS